MLIRPSASATPDLSRVGRERYDDSFRNVDIINNLPAAVTAVNLTLVMGAMLTRGTHTASAAAGKQANLEMWDVIENTKRAANCLTMLDEANIAMVSWP